MKETQGKAAAGLPFLHSSRMLTQVPIRLATAVTLLSLAMLAATQVTEGQISSLAQTQESSQLSIPLISAREMAPDDRSIAQSWQAAIVGSAQFFGFSVDPTFTYRQIACPVAPHHLLLAYEAVSSSGTISRFTAVVRRGMRETIEGHPGAQIIPILHFGVVPFIPAIANPHSIEVFNTSISPAPSATTLLSANQAGNQPLLVRALCYLAMVGEEPAALGSPPSNQETIHAPVPTVVFQDTGKIREQISIRSSQNSYQVWALTFRPGGNLLTATHQEHSIDRTPLVLNASVASPITPTSTVENSVGAAQVSSPSTSVPLAAASANVATVRTTSSKPVTPIVAVSPSPTQTTAQGTTRPIPLSSPADAAAPEPSAQVAPASGATIVSTIKAEPTREVPVPPPTDAEARSVGAVTVPTTESIAPEVVPVAATIAPTPTSAGPSIGKPESAAVASASLPPVSPNGGSGMAMPASATISTPALPSASLVARQPVVRPSPPLPVGRLIQNLPQPPSRFIPDSALKTPPHLIP